MASASPTQVLALPEPELAAFALDEDAELAPPAPPAPLVVELSSEQPAQALAIRRESVVTARSDRRMATR
jgi:hypothetical protein